MDDFYSSIRWVKDSASFAQKVRQLGHQVSIRVCNSDTAVQHQQAKELLKEGVDVLAIVPADCFSAYKIVEDAHRKHVPVIAYDRLVMNSDVDYYVSFDAVEVGEIMAQFIVDTLHGKGTVMLVNGPKSDHNATLFREGQLKILKPYIESGKIKLAYDNQLSAWTNLESMMETNSFLSGYSGAIDGVIAANDDMAEGVLEAFSFSRPSLKVPVTGQDATPLACSRIVKGTQAMTVFKPVDSLAYEAAALSVQLALGKQPNTKITVFNGKNQVPFLQLDPILLTSKNIKKYVPDVKR